MVSNHEPEHQEQFLVCPNEDETTTRSQREQLEQQEEAYFRGLIFDMSPPTNNEAPAGPAPRWNASRNGPPPLKRWGHATMVLSKVTNDEDDEGQHNQKNEDPHHMIVVLGGCTSDSLTDSVMAWSPKQQHQEEEQTNHHWRERPRLNEKRWGHAAVQCNKFVYVIGGIGKQARHPGRPQRPQDHDSTYFDTFDYDSLDTIERTPASILLDHRPPRSYYYMCYQDDEYDNSYLAPSSPSRTTQSEQQAPPWSTLKCRLSCPSTCLTSSSSFSVATTTDRKGCVAAVAVRDRYVVILTGSYHVEILDTKQLILVQGPPLNIPRWWCGAAVLDAGHCRAEILVVGGVGCATVESLQFYAAPQEHDYQDDSSRSTNDYDHEENALRFFDASWKMRHDLTLTCGERSHHAVTTAWGPTGSLVVVVGGQNKAFERHKSVEVLDPQRGKVWRLPDIRVARDSCSVVTVPFDTSLSTTTRRAPPTPFSCFDQLLIVGGHSGCTTLYSIISFPFIDLSFTGLMRRIRHLQGSQQHLLLRMLVSHTLYAQHQNIHTALRNAYNENVCKLTAMQQLWNTLLFYHLSRNRREQKSSSRFFGGNDKPDRTAGQRIGTHLARRGNGLDGGRHLIMDLLDSLPRLLVELPKWEFMIPMSPPQPDQPNVQLLSLWLQTSEMASMMPCLELVGILTRQIDDLAKVQQSKWLRMVFAKMNHHPDDNEEDSTNAIRLLNESLYRSVVQRDRLQLVVSTLIFASISRKQGAAAQLSKRYFETKATSHLGETSLVDDCGVPSPQAKVTATHHRQENQQRLIQFLDQYPNLTGGRPHRALGMQSLIPFLTRPLWALATRIQDLEETLQESRQGLLLQTVYDAMRTKGEDDMTSITSNSTTESIEGDDDTTVATSTTPRDRYNYKVFKLQRLKQLQDSLVFSHLSSGKEAVDFLLSNYRQQHRARHTVTNHTFKNPNVSSKKTQMTFIAGRSDHIMDLMQVEGAPVWALKARIHQMEHLQYELLLELVLSQMNGGTTGVNTSSTLKMRCKILAANCSQLRRLLNTLMYSYLVKGSTNIGRVPLPVTKSRLLHRVHGPVSCPRLFVLVKPSCPQKRSFFANRRVSCVLYFLCAHDLTKVEPGIVLETDTCWFEKVAPALATSLYLMRLSVARNYGVSVDFEDWLARRFGTEPIVDERTLSLPVSSSLSRYFSSSEFDMQHGKALPHELYGYVEALQQRLRHRLYQLEDSIQTQLDWTTVEHEAFCVCPESYDTIARVAEDYPQWRNEMNFCCSVGGDNEKKKDSCRSGSNISQRGGVWVKNQNIAEWLQEKNSQAFYNI